MEVSHDARAIGLLSVFSPYYSVIGELMADR